MSALGHYIEEEGVSTVAISLVRPQTENVRPPRALWVPFDLGRPFGPPSDPRFQKRVILAALRLLDREIGPIILEDFPDDDPRERPDPDWRPPIAKSLLADDLAIALATEINALDRAYRRSFDERGRTLVGLSGLSVPDAGRYVAACLRGDTPESPSTEMSAPLTLRYAVDDLKAYYIEVALVGAAKPSSKQVGDWFWNETAAGATIFALRQVHLTSADDRLKAIAGLFLLPGIRVPPTG